MNPSFLQTRRFPLPLLQLLLLWLLAILHHRAAIIRVVVFLILLLLLDDLPPRPAPVLICILEASTWWALFMIFWSC